MTGPRRRRARARIALALAVLWIAGFEVMPWLHVALHDRLAPHHHDLSGAIVAAEQDDHDAEVDEHAGHDDDDLDGDVDEHGAPVHAHQAPSSMGTSARLASALAHGAHSLAHHGVAVPMPALVLDQPLPVDRRPTFVAQAIGLEPISLAPARAVARGPPSTAAA